MWIFVAVYGWVGREVGSVAAFYGSLWSDRPIDNFYDTPHTRALRASLKGMTPGAVVAAIAGLVAIGLTYKRLRAWSLAVGFIAAAVAGAIAGFCSGHF
jgi:hypothetical protein